MTAIVIRNCPNETKKMGIDQRTTIPQRCVRILEIAHEIHRILVSAPGSTKRIKLRDIGRVFGKEMLDLRDVFNVWDQKQVIRFSRLTRSINITGIMPFTRAPTAVEIQAAQEHASTLKEDEKKQIISAYNNKLSRQGGNSSSNNSNTRRRGRYTDYDDEDCSSVSSSGSSSGSESCGTEESRERLLTEIQRARHATPFIAGGKVMYAPRRPHTRGSRALTGMELDVVPLVTGARESVEHATSLSSPRRKPHPSWKPHVELTRHPTFGNKYHGHHLHVHHHAHGDGWKDQGTKGRGGKYDDRHDANGHIIHKHHHHHHRTGGGGGSKSHGHRMTHPKTLRECILSHETDVSILSQAYKTEQLKFPPSWKEAADKAAKEAQQVQILKDDTPPVTNNAAATRAHGSHHNVYAIEAHGKPAAQHRVFQQLVETAQKSMSNQPLKQFSASSYKKMLALNIYQQKISKQKERQILEQGTTPTKKNVLHVQCCVWMCCGVG